VENGDKPGIGIELTQNAGRITGQMFLLDPDSPGDFAAGSPRTMYIHHVTEKEIRFRVDWLPDRHDEMVLRLDSPLNADRVKGVLKTADKSGRPQDYEFVRIK